MNPCVLPLSWLGPLGGDEGRERVAVLLLQFDQPAQPLHFVQRGQALGLPAVRSEPFGDVGPARVLVDLLLNVDRLALVQLAGELREAFPHLLTALTGGRPGGLDSDPAARCRELGDQLEQPVLGVGGEIHQ